VNYNKTGFLLAILLLLGNFLNVAASDHILLIAEREKLSYDNSSPLLSFFEDSTAVRRFHQVIPGKEITQVKSLNPGDVLLLNLFPEREYSAVIDDITSNTAGSKTIRARISDYDSSYLILTTTRGRSSAEIRLPELNEFYRLISDPLTDVHFLLDIDVNRRPVLEESPVIIPPALTSQERDEQDRIRISRDRSRPDQVVEVDIMVTYTPSALNWANSSGGGIDNVIANAMASGQLVLDNSNALISLNLVHSVMVDYVESGVGSIDLRRITASPFFNPWGSSYDGYDIPGYMEEVHTLREIYGADFVVLLVNNTNVGGVAWLLSDINGRPNYAFSLTKIQQAAGSSYTFIHEIGHNMGLHHHAQQNYQPGPTLWANWPGNNWSAGWRWTGTNNSRFCTVMSYTGGSYYDDGLTHSRVPLFSNPAIIYQGVAAGDAALADNSRTLREMRDVYAAYRPTSDLSPLAGIYSIDQNGLGDYSSLTDALGDLQIRGLGGSVIYEVQPGIYAEQLSIPEIQGSSPVRTVTFRGAGEDPSETIITYTPMQSQARHVVRLEGARHLRFENLKLEATADSEYGWVFLIMNDSQDIEITGCFISTVTATTSSNYAGIIVSGEMESTHVGASNVHTLVIENNLIEGGQRSISLRGSNAANSIAGIRIAGNTLLDSYFYGIYAYHSTAPLILNNCIQLSSDEFSTPNSYGICLFYAFDDFEIAYNKIQQAGQHGIYVNYGSNDGTSPSLIYNNMIGGGFRNNTTSASGIHITRSSNISVYFNSINMDAEQGRGINVIRDTSGLSVLNNSFAFTGSGEGYAAYYYSPAFLIAHDHNNYFAEFSSSIVYYGADISTLPELRTINIPPGNDQNSRTGDPQYIGNTDLYIQGDQLMNGGIPVDGIADDIDGELRDLINPCIGAHELPGLITELDSPVVTIAIANETVYLSWQPVENANSYLIYAREDQSDNDWGEPVERVSIPEYSEPVTGKRFFKVTASTEIIP